MTHPSTVADTLDVLGAALGEYDAVVAACPANKRFLGEQLCPKCGASSNEGCGREGLAAYTFINIVRHLLADHADEIAA